MVRGKDTPITRLVAEALLRQGRIDALKDLYFYMVTRQMLPASFIAAYGSNKGDVKDFERCMESCGKLCEQMFRIIEKGFAYPDVMKASYIAYGTHTF